MRILLVADPAPELTLLPVLEKEGLFVEAAESLDCVDFKLQTRSYEAVVCDSRPDSILTSLPRWRAEGVKAYVIVMLPRTSTANDRAHCLDAGADACLTHPINTEELCAHLRALRRREYTSLAPVRRIHDLEINVAVRTVQRAGQPIHLTPREFDLLHLLASHQGKVLTRSMIMEHLYDSPENSCSNVIDVYIRYLRHKIDEGFETPLILTRWGQGYLLRPEETPVE
jgi:DNA-binding response OmpR family regulator